MMAGTWKQANRGTFFLFGFQKTKQKERPPVGKERPPVGPVILSAAKNLAPSA
jgi:hypothetical protein